MKSQITLHMVASLDGYIANDDASFAWLNTDDSYDGAATEPDEVAILQSIDCYVIGARTYETALRLGWPYGDKPTYVLTHAELKSDRSNVSFHSGDLTDFINQLKQRHASIWVVGGSVLVRECLRAGLADDIRLVLAPILIGDGIPFFDHVGRQLPLHLKEAAAYRNGLVSLWYEIRKT